MSSRGLINTSQDTVADWNARDVRFTVRKGKRIKKAIERANKKYPKEALEVNDRTINDVAAHYEYLLEHENIMKKMH